MTGTSITVDNILSLCAAVSDSISGTRKKHKEIMAIRIVSRFFYGASSIVLKGYSSTAQNAVAVFRSLAAMKKVKSRVLEWILIAAGVVLGIVFNNRGLLGRLPIVANLEYSIAVFRFRDNEIALKSAFIVNMIMYAAFSAVILNYVGIASCAVIAITTSISLIKTIRKNVREKPKKRVPYPKKPKRINSAMFGKKIPADGYPSAGIS